MSALVVLLVGLLAGIAVRRIMVRRGGRVSEQAHHVLGVWVLDVALPALVLKAMHAIAFPDDVGLVVAAPYALFVASTAVYLILGRLLRMRRDVVAALVATTAVANTSFVGIPMVTAYFGAEAVPIAVLVDQLGSFMLLSTAVTVVVVVGAGADAAGADAAAAAGADPAGARSETGAGTRSALDVRRIARRIITAPPLLAMLAGLALRPVEFPSWLADALTQLGATLTPIALFAVGLRLEVGATRVWRFELLLGLATKLLLVPAVVIGGYAVLGVLDDPAVQVALFEITMPPMVAGSMMASRHGLADPLPSLLVGAGVPISLLTVAGWSWLLHR